MQVLFWILSLWLTVFCCWVVFIFWNLSLFVTVLEKKKKKKKKQKKKKKKCTRHGIIVNMKGCVKGPARFLEDCILKSELVSTVSRLA